MSHQGHSLSNAANLRFLLLLELFRLCVNIATTQLSYFLLLFLQLGRLRLFVMLAFALGDTSPLGIRGRLHSIDAIGNDYLRYSEPDHS